jgi:proteasome lid subunit RPN8/RPN11
MRIRMAVLDVITAHARREAPRECCGLLIGTVDEIVEAVATHNVAADPLRRYEVSPVEHFAHIKRCREQHANNVVGVYHSHPHSAPEPSPTDREHAFSDCLFVIAGPVDDRREMEIRAYRLSDGTLEAVRLDPIP